MIFTSSNAEISAISAYLKDYTFYDAEKEKTISYFVWDKTSAWSGLYGEEVNGKKQLALDDRLSLVAKEAIKRSNGTEDGFYYISIPTDSAKGSDAAFWEHLIYQMPADRESKENYQILYLSFEDANQLIKSYQETK